MNTSPTPSFFTAVPPPVAAFLERLPPYPGSLMLTTALNIGLADQLPDDVKQLLANRKLRIHVRDAHLTFDFTWSGDGFSALSPGAPADLTISASAYDFLQLAQRREDPDTLFFSRRLSMEGDTELGLVVKNALDALELPVLEWQRWAPHRVLARVFPRAPMPGIGPRHHGETHGE